MRRYRLFLQSRQSFLLSALMLLCAATGAVISRWKPTLLLSLEMHNIATQLIFLVIPCALACLIGLSLTSPFEHLEQLFSQPLMLLRLWHLCTLTGLATAALLCMARTWQSPAFTIIATRNFAGFLGLSLLTGVFAGGRLSWLLPLIAATTPMFGQMTIPQSAHLASLVLWPIHEHNDPLATGIAVTLLCAGMFPAIGWGEKALAHCDSQVSIQIWHWRQRFTMEQSRQSNAPYRLTFLYARSHLLVLNLTALLATGFLAWMTTLAAPTADSSLWAPFFANLVCILPAITTTISFSSPSGDIEQTLPLRLRGIRVCYHLLLSSSAITAILLPASLADHTASWYLAGAFIGNIGLTLISWKIFGLAWCWLLPLGYGIVVYLPYIADARYYLEQGFPWWMWPIAPTITAQTCFSEISILLIGIGVHTINRSIQLTNTDC